MAGPYGRGTRRRARAPPGGGRAGGVGGGELLHLAAPGLLHLLLKELHHGDVFLLGELRGFADEIGDAFPCGVEVDFERGTGQILAHVHAHGVAHPVDFVLELVAHNTP